MRKEWRQLWFSINNDKTDLLHIFYIIWYNIAFQKIQNKNKKEKENMIPDSHCCWKSISVVKLHFDYFRTKKGALARFHQQTHAQISFTHGHLQISFLCKSSEHRYQMGVFPAKRILYLISSLLKTYDIENCSKK